MGIFNENITHIQTAISQRGPTGVGFKLTYNGDYDIDNKKLKNIANPSDNTDAINKQWIRHYLAIILIQEI